MQGIVAFTFDDQAVERMERQQKGVVASHSKGVINEVLEVINPKPFSFFFFQ